MDRDDWLSNLYKTPPSEWQKDTYDRAFVAIHRKVSLMVYTLGLEHGQATNVKDWREEKKDWTQDTLIKIASVWSKWQKTNSRYYIPWGKQVVSNYIITKIRHALDPKIFKKGKRYTVKSLEKLLEALQRGDEEKESPIPSGLRDLIKAISETTDDPQSYTEAKQFKQLLWLKLAPALKELKDEERKAVILDGYHDVDLVDIALSLNIPVGTAKSRVSRAHKKLRKILGEDFYSEFYKE
jgi:RNA polymerase sigma factor (sigma-70 family)